jgi:hypothetical protein
LANIKASGRRKTASSIYKKMKNSHLKFSVMFWGFISYYGVGTLTPVVGNLNSEIFN